MQYQIIGNQQFYRYTAPYFINLILISSIMKTVFGLCCQSCLYPKLSAKSTTTLTYLNKLPAQKQQTYLLSKARSNISNLKNLLKVVNSHGIQAFRLSDTFIPMSDLGYYNIEKQLGKELQEVGKVANDLDMHISSHPSQFFLLSSKNQQVNKTSIKNFDIFSKVLALMKLKYRPIIVTHVGALKGYSSWQQACDVFCQNFRKTSPQTQSFLTVQNDQNSHSINSCMYIHNKTSIPVVFDHAHYKYNPVQGISQREAVKLAMKTWGDRVPKVHLCSQAPGVKIHNHAEYVEYQDYQKLRNDILACGVQKVIMMAEVKKKDQAIIKLMEQIKTKQHLQTQSHFA